MCNKKERKRDKRWYLFPVSTLGAVYFVFCCSWRDGAGLVFFRGGTGRLFFFSEAGRGGCFFFPRRDGAVVFFFRGGTGRLLFFSEAGRGGCFFFRGGTGWFFFFFRRDGTGRCFFFFFEGRDGTVVFEPKALKNYSTKSRPQEAVPELSCSLDCNRSTYFNRPAVA